MNAPQLPPGVARLTVLPEHHGSAEWRHLVLPGGVKERLLNQALLSLRHRARLDRDRTALQGLILLTGPTGTGKTTAARGLAAEVAAALSDKGTTSFVELDPHALPSEMLGESQRNVVRLLGSALLEIARRRPFTIVLADEVEALAPRRSIASFETNPADLHRATDAVLMGLDEVARAHPSVLFVATTNFSGAVDEALMSRADLVEHFELPDASARAAIIRDSLAALAESWPALAPLCDDGALADELATLCDGADGRAVRKLVVTSLTRRKATALDPSGLTAEDLRATFGEDRSPPTKTTLRALDPYG